MAMSGSSRGPRRARLVVFVSLWVLLVLISSDPERAFAVTYGIWGSACSAQNGGQCATCIASVEQTTGGNWACYANTCSASTARFSTCVVTGNSADRCGHTGVSTNACSNCRYWFCGWPERTPGGNWLCSLGSCNCPATGGTQYGN